MKKRILIVEDEVLISEHLKRIVQNLGYEVTNICVDYEDVVELLHYTTPDFAFVDIRMKGKDEGIEVAKILNKRSIPFVFITSFADKETLKKAVNQQPLGYILKPFSPDDIQEQLNLINEKFLNDYLILGGNHSKEKIIIKDILYLKSDNVYVEIHTKTKKHVFREKLSTLLKSLPENTFIRTHQSYIVNINEIGSVSTKEVTINNAVIPLSKTYKKHLLEKFANL